MRPKGHGHDVGARVYVQNDDRPPYGFVWTPGTVQAIGRGWTDVVLDAPLLLGPLGTFERWIVYCGASIRASAVGRPGCTCVVVRSGKVVCRTCREARARRLRG